MNITPAAYLLHGGRLFQDRASTHLVHAEKDQKDRNDGSKIEPLLRQSEVEFADSERQSQIRGLEIALCGYADQVDQLTARNAELEAEVDAVSAAIGTTRYMDPPDGGCPSLGEQVARMKEELVEGQGQYEQLDRLMQANERNMQRRIDGLTAEVARLEHLVGLKNVSISRYRNVLESIDLTFRDIRLSTERSRSIMADIARNALKESGL